MLFMLHKMRVAIRFPHHKLPKILNWYACGADGRAGGQAVFGHVPNFLGLVI